MCACDRQARRNMRHLRPKATVGTSVNTKKAGTIHTYIRTERNVADDEINPQPGDVG